MTERFIQVEDAPGLVRDTKSGAIIHGDTTAYLEAKQKRTQANTVIEQGKKIKILELRMAALEQSIRNMTKIIETLS